MLCDKDIHVWINANSDINLQIMNYKELTPTVHIYNELERYLNTEDRQVKIVKPGVEIHDIFKITVDGIINSDEIIMIKHVNANLSVFKPFR